MNVEIGTEATQLLFWEYINQSSFAVYTENIVHVKEQTTNAINLQCRKRKRQLNDANDIMLVYGYISSLWSNWTTQESEREYVPNTYTIDSRL